MKKIISALLSLVMIIATLAALPLEANAIPTWYEFWHGSNQPVIDKEYNYRHPDYDAKYEDGILYFSRPYGEPPLKHDEAEDTKYVDINVYLTNGTYSTQFNNVPTPYEKNNPVDVATRMNENKFPSGYYSFNTVDPITQIFWMGDSNDWYRERQITKRSRYGQFQYVSPYETLEAPNFLRWEGSTCKWEAVDNADEYRVELYDDQGYYRRQIKTAGTEWDFNDASITVGDGYYFTVTATSEGNYLTSREAVSPSKKSYTLELNPNKGHGSTSTASQVINNVSGKYVLPQTTSYAAADGYKFVGWSLTQSGDELITSLDVNDHTTVYAIWKKYTASIGDGVYYNIDGSDLYIYGTGKMYNYTQGAPNPSPFYNNTSINTIYIAGGVTSIGDNAFYGCSNVETVYLDNATDLTEIGFNAFQNCSSLAKIDYPGNLSEDIQTINSGAFKNCSSLTEFRIPSNVKYIVANAFEGCTNLKYISIPKTVTNIYKDVFKGCSSLTDIFYSGSEEEWAQVDMGNNAAVLSYATLHPYTSWGVSVGAHVMYTVDAFGQRGTLSGTGATFNYAMGKSPILQRPVTEITVEQGVTVLGKYLFAGMEALNTVTLPNGLKTIGEGVFRDCNNMETLTVPDSVTTVDDYATAWCGRLATLTLGSGVKNVGRYTFWGSPMEKVYYNGTKEQFDTISISDTATNTSLTDAAFYSVYGPCGDNATYRYNPDTATLTISGTGNMKDFGAHTNRPWYNYRDEIKHAVVEDGITSLCSCCFMETGITDVALADSITTFGTSTFLRCTDLTQIVLPQKLKKIETSDFNYCTDLTDVVLNDGLETIGFLSFANCTALKGIMIPDSVTNILAQAFGGCSALQSFAMPSKADKIEFYMFQGCENLKSVYIPKNVTTIETGILMDCPNVTDIYYEGSQADWKKIAIDYANGYNDILKTVTIHYNFNSVANAKVTGVKAKTYSGKAQYQSPVVKMNGITLKKGTDYKLSYKNNTKVGTATVTITGIGAFSGRVKKTFKINPKGTSLSSVSKGKKAFTVKWKKQTTQITGYQIQCATDKSFKKNCKTVTVKKNKTVKTTVKKLKAKKKYYVRVRTYKTVNNTKYYSGWSKAKTVTTK